MQVFLVCSMSSPSQVLGRVKEHYDTNFLSVDDTPGSAYCYGQSDHSAGG